MFSKELHSHVFSGAVILKVVCNTFIVVFYVGKLYKTVKVVKDLYKYFILWQTIVKTLNIGTPRPATVAVLNLKQFNFTMK